MTIWMISGEAGTDSAGGEVTVFAITPRADSPPDPHAAIRQARPRWEWSVIESITAIGSIPDAWDLDRVDDDSLTAEITAVVWPVSSFYPHRRPRKR